MLEKQKWMYFPADMDIEWRQALDEGKDVADLRGACLEVSKRPRSEQAETEAEELLRRIDAAPPAAGYVYIEPSDLASILAARPPSVPLTGGTPDRKTLEDKITGAWLGRVAGCLLGKPVEGFLKRRLDALLKATGNYPLSRYMEAGAFTPALAEELKLSASACWADTTGGFAPVDDDTNYTVLALKIVETFGMDFRPADVLEAWLFCLPMFATFTAERAAYRNAAAGLLPPATALRHNPYREWIGAQIRGDFYGYIHPGNPEAAAQTAWRDASVSHVKNGIYGEMFVAAMISAAAVCGEAERVVEAGLAQIPRHSRLAEAVRGVLEQRAAGLPFEEVAAGIHGRYDESQSHGWCHTVPNAMIVAAALLYGGLDFGKTVCLAVSCAFDTDCNGATAGSVLGMMLGAGGVPAYWRAPFANGVRTSIPDYAVVTAQDFVTKTLAFAAPAP